MSVSSSEEDDPSAHSHSDQSEASDASDDEGDSEQPDEHDFWAGSGSASAAVNAGSRSESRVASMLSDLLGSSSKGSSKSLKSHSRSAFLQAQEETNKGLKSKTKPGKSDKKKQGKKKANSAPKANKIAASSRSSSLSSSSKPLMLGTVLAYFEGVQNKAHPHRASGAAGKPVLACSDPPSAARIQKLASVGLSVSHLRKDKWEHGIPIPVSWTFRNFDRFLRKELPLLFKDHIDLQEKIPNPAFREGMEACFEFLPGYVLAMREGRRLIIAPGASFPNGETINRCCKNGIRGGFKDNYLIIAPRIRVPVSVLQSWSPLGDATLTFSDDDVPAVPRKRGRPPKASTSNGKGKSKAVEISSSESSQSDNGDSTSSNAGSPTPKRPRTRAAMRARSQAKALAIDLTTLSSSSESELPELSTLLRTSESPSPAVRTTPASPEPSYSLNAKYSQPTIDQSVQDPWKEDEDSFDVSF